MSTIDESRVRALVEQAVERLRAELPAAAAGRVVAPETGSYVSVDDAVAATRQAQREWAGASLSLRHRVVAAIREIGLAHLDQLAHEAVAETGLGRVADKREKLKLVLEKTPGPEDLDARRRVWTGDRGMTLIELAPYGVIGAITPVTNPADTVFNNAISFVSAGNGAIFNAHPSAAGVSRHAVALVHQAIVEGGGPANLITAVHSPTIETAHALMRARGVDLLVVTGGPHVVKAALESRKKVIAGGPGNPPVVVDETADLARAARAIYQGASFDNNVICTLEKSVVAVSSIADALKTALVAEGAYEVPPDQQAALFRAIFSEDRGPRREGVINKAFVGQDASTILEAIGVSVDRERCRLAIVEVPPEHPLLWTEQLMPVLPLTRVADAEAAMALAVELEGGRGHTMVMHSRDIDRLSRMARRAGTAIFVKNGPSLAALGWGGEAPTAWTIAGPTGEGCTSAKNFTKERRCTLVDAFRIV